MVERQNKRNIVSFTSILSSYRERSSFSSKDTMDNAQQRPSCLRTLISSLSYFLCPSLLSVWIDRAILICLSISRTSSLYMPAMYRYTHTCTYLYMYIETKHFFCSALSFSSSSSYFFCILFSSFFLQLYLLSLPLSSVGLCLSSVECFCWRSGWTGSSFCLSSNSTKSKRMHSTNINM